MLQKNRSKYLITFHLPYNKSVKTILDKDLSNYYQSVFGKKLLYDKIFNDIKIKTSFINSMKAKEGVTEQRQFYNLRVLVRECSLDNKCFLSNIVCSHEVVMQQKTPENI